MTRTRATLLSLPILIIAVGGWILRPVAPDRPDTVDWERTQALIEADGIPLSSKTNVVLAVVCTLRQDRLEPYGFNQPTSPFLDTLAADGVVLNRHYTQAPWTRPSSGSLLTGRWPRALQLDNPGKRSSLSLVLDDRHTTLAEHLDAAGYTTIGSTGNPNLKAQFGLAQGLNVWWEPPNTFKEGDVRIDGHDQVDFLLDAVDDVPIDEPVYMQLVLTDPHTPRRPPLRYLRMFTDTLWKPGRRATYNATVRQADAVLARLFTEMKDRRPDTLFILANDHGEGLRHPRNHGRGHGNHLYPTTIGGTSIWHHPALVPQRSDALTMNIDVVPTVLGALQLAAPDADGEDLSAGMTGAGPFPERSVVFSETYYGKTRKLSAIGRGFQYIRNQRPTKDPTRQEMLFAHSDALSETNVIADHPEEAQTLRDALDAWDAAMTVLWNAAGTLNEIELSDDTKAQLEALGYLD